MTAPLLACRDLVVSIGGKQIVGGNRHSRVGGIPGNSSILGVSGDQNDKLDSRLRGNDGGLNLSLHPGERLVILGRNGVGKTTLLHTLAGLRTPDAGEIRLAGDRYASLGPRCAARLRGLLPQHQGDAFSASVLETVLVGRHPYLSRWDWESTADETLARDALAAVGLAELAQRSIHTLSGGERQRVALATLLVQQPRVYLLDEPLAHLDLNHQIAVLELISRRVRDESAALVMVLHDVNLAAQFSDCALLLHGQGEHELGASAAVLDAASLTLLYGHPLREVRDANGRWLVPEIAAMAERG